MELSHVVDALLTVFEERRPSAKEGDRFTVSRTVSTLAVLYEKARNAVEFRAEHLVRRAAIERIFKRRMMLNGGTNAIAGNLITELLWARYIDSSLLDDAKARDIQRIIDRYLHLKHEFFPSGKKHDGITWDTIMGLASSEIDETIVSARQREALNNFFYQAIRPKITIAAEEERFTNVQTFIGIERAFAQSDDAPITFHLLRLIQPQWFTSSPDTVAAEAPLLFQNLTYIQTSLRHPIGEAIYRYVRKQTPPFLLIRDFLNETDGKARNIIENEVEFEQKLAEIANQRYHQIGTKVRRAVIRSIVYIFLTKMVFALALEAPFDLFITKRLSYLPLAINIVFPPIMLFLIAGLFSVPGPDNTKRLMERIKKIFYRFDELKNETDVFVPKERVSRPILTAVFSVFYLITFLLSFGLISFILTSLHFNIASQIIFVFFITLVSFFAYRIRVSAKEYEVVERQGFLEPLADFFFLPILRAGHILSREITKLNIFIFLFDFILEAPLKVIFEVTEEWIRFIQTKKEEII